MAEKRKEQTVVRTRPKFRQYSYESAAYENLSMLLKKGYRVVMCNQIGDELEYILEKEVCDREESGNG